MERIYAERKTASVNNEKQRTLGEKKQDASYQDQRGAHPGSINLAFAPTKGMATFRTGHTFEYVRKYMV